MLLHAWHVASNASPVGRVQAVCHVRSQYRINRPYRVYVFLGCVSIPVMTISHVMTSGTMDGNRYARTGAHATGSLSFEFFSCGLMLVDLAISFVVTTQPVGYNCFSAREANLSRINTCISMQIYGYSNSVALAMELWQFCAKPSKYEYMYQHTYRCLSSLTVGWLIDL